MHVSLTSAAVVQAHGWLMGIAFAVVLPLAIVVAARFRGAGRIDRWWLWTHAMLQVSQTSNPPVLTTNTCRGNVDMTCVFSPLASRLLEMTAM